MFWFHCFVFVWFVCFLVVQVPDLLSPRKTSFCTEDLAQWSFLMPVVSPLWRSGWHWKPMGLSCSHSVWPPSLRLWFSSLARLELTIRWMKDFRGSWLVTISKLTEIGYCSTPSLAHETWGWSMLIEVMWLSSAAMHWWSTSRWPGENCRNLKNSKLSTTLEYMIPKARGLWKP